MSEYNQHLLAPYDVGSTKMFPDKWPIYDPQFLTEPFKKKFALQIATGKPT